MAERQLTRVEAVSLMVGAGVGAGIMAVPFLARQVGLVGLAILLPIAWAASSLVHLMLAEVLFRTGKDLQIVELMRLYVLRGRVGHVVLWTIFGLLATAFVANLAAYISGAGEIVTDLTGLAPGLAQSAVYLVSAGVVFFGLKAIGVAERFGALLLVGLVVAISLGALGVPFRPPIVGTGGPNVWLALYSMVMYAYWTFYSVPQVVKGMGPDRQGAVRAVVLGLAINGGLTAVVALIALGVSNPVTELAIIGVADAVGPWAGVTGSLFILLAFVTSYWSVSLALADIIRERVHVGERTAWVLATVPPQLLIYAGAWQYLDWLRLAAGATAVVVALITLPMYRRAQRTGPVAHPEWTLGRLGGPAVVAAVVVALALMAVGAVVST
jgi:amino acid permease